MSGQELLALAERVENAAGPDRELDAEIASVQDLRAVDEGHPLGWQCYDAAGKIAIFPRYTASLDAAMTLVPRKLEILMQIVVSATEVRLIWLDDDREVCVTADTPALALTAACLRARAAIAHATESRQP